MQQVKKKTTEMVKQSLCTCSGWSTLRVFALGITIGIISAKYINQYWINQEETKSETMDDTPVASLSVLYESFVESNEFEDDDEENETQLLHSEMIKKLTSTMSLLKTDPHVITWKFESVCLLHYTITSKTERIHEFIVYNGHVMNLQVSYCLKGGNRKIVCIPPFSPAYITQFATATDVDLYTAVEQVQLTAKYIPADLNDLLQNEKKFQMIGETNDDDDNEEEHDESSEEPG